MEVKPDYKQTEVGVIPQEWEAMRVCEFGSVITGGTPRTEIQSYWNGGYPWVTPTDITGRRDMWASERMISESGLRSIRQLPANSVLVTCIASIGKNAILRSVGGCNQQINAVVPEKEQSSEFLYYSFENSKQYLLANAGMTATRIISKAAFEQLKFPIPPPPEQRAIATTLSDVDALLSGLDALIAKKRDLKQAAMQQLLTGQTRLPGFYGEWKVKTVGELLSRLCNGAVYRPAHSSGVPVTRIETIADGTIDMTRVGMGEPTAELEAYRIQAGDILFSHINSLDHIGKVAIYNGELPLYHGMNLLLLRAGATLNGRFLFYWLGSYQGRKKAAALAKQSVSQASINTGELRGVELPVPSLAEQTAIAEVLTDMDEELAALERRREKTRALKQAMMQELLTGKTRLV